jgi:hypothetical protein
LEKKIFRKNRTRVFQKIIIIIYTKLRKRKVKEKKIEKKWGKNKILRKASSGRRVLTQNMGQALMIFSKKNNKKAHFSGLKNLQQK